MNKITIEMPLVTSCSASQCAYNEHSACHARAITIGDTEHPGCDTYLAGSAHTHHMRLAGIGACKMSNCKFNEDLECMAENVKVGLVLHDANCLTYSQ